MPSFGEAFLCLFGKVIVKRGLNKQIKLML